MMQTERQLAEAWVNDPRWAGISRPYSARDVVRLRGTVAIERYLGQLGELRSTLRLLKTHLCPALHTSLRQALRLISALIAKLRAFSRAIDRFKKAVYERRFFVMHETHPPALAVICCGLFAGAFQAA
jgi:hypothetical protein